MRGNPYNGLQTFILDSCAWVFVWNKMEIEMNGYIKLHRKVLHNQEVCRDAETFAIWIYLLLNATHEPIEKMFNGKLITLQAGQLITGRKKISEQFGICESKVQRVLQTLDQCTTIERLTCRHNTLITITSWADYQHCEQLSNDYRTTIEHKQEERTKKKENTIPSKKSDKPIISKEPPTKEQIVEYAKELGRLDLVDKFYNYFTATKWYDSKGKQVKNWKLKFASWSTFNEKPQEVKTTKGFMSPTEWDNFKSKGETV